MKNFSSKKVIILSVILVFIILIIGLSIYFMFFQTNSDIPVTGENKDKQELKDIEYEEIKNNFNKIFTNSVRKSITLSSEPEKEDASKEIVYTKYEVNLQSKDKYEINVSIPYININNEQAQSINNEIDAIFGSKVNSVIQAQDIISIYNVDYVVYLNDDMFSLVIRANLKENDEPQRTIIKTYNYNFARQEQVNLGSLLVRNALDKNAVQNKIHEEIGKVIKTNEALEANGYTVYKRYLSNNRYLLQNIDTYYVDQNDNLYIVFAYGNQNYTNELDLVIF